MLSISEQAAASTNVSMRSSGYSSFGHALLRMVKSMHIRHLPFFFSTITTFASHSGYCTSQMTPASSNFCTSACAAFYLSSDIGRGLCFAGLAFGFTLSVCSMTPRLTPRKSDEDHANMSWLFRRNWISLASSSPLPMVTIRSGMSSHNGTFFVCSAGDTPSDFCVLCVLRW